MIGGTGTIRRVDAATGEKLGELRGHKIVITCLRVSPDGKWLASTGADGFLRIWSTKHWEEQRAVKLEQSGVLQIAFAPASDVVAVAVDHLIQSYSIKDGKTVERIEVPVKGLYGIAISPVGTMLANAAADGRVRIWRR